MADAEGAGDLLEGKAAGIAAKRHGHQTWRVFGAPASPRAVVIERIFFNPQAEQLRSALP